MIHLISKKLPDITDVIRFRAVCTPWRTSVLLSNPSLRLPWLYLHDENGPISSTNLRFYSLSNDKTYTVEVPEVQGKAICGSLRQYLLVCDRKGGDSSLSLINSLTRKEISLPPRPPSRGFLIPTQVGPDLFRNGEFDCVVVFGMRPSTVSFWRVGDEKWLSVETEMDMQYHYNHLYHNGIYYADSINETIAKNMRTGAVLYNTTPSPPNPSSGLVRKESVLMKIDGELIKVFKLCKFASEDLDYEEQNFEASIVDHGNGKPSWVKYEIKDLMLFVNSSA
ncbi:hypothetical protein LUZ60_016715 [Juncus effusus]|nr:hypothetical protein LUZ60_016715 [Juncus effusus]